MAGKFFWIALGMFSAFSGGVQAQSDTLRVLFAGDIMQHEAQLVSAQRDSAQYDYSECFRYIAPEVRAADLAIANLETPVGAPPYSGYPRFSAPAAFARAIREAGFDLLVTANNHSLDRYKRGIIRTVEVLDSLGVPHTGVFLDSTQRKERHPLFFHYRDFRFALLNYTYGTNGIPDYPPVEVSRIDTAQIAQDLAVARAGKPDFVIVCVHWGREYEMLPEPSQKDLAQFFFDRGADLVIGSHPHVVQPMHAYRDSTGRIERQKRRTAGRKYFFDTLKGGQDAPVLPEMWGSFSAAEFFGNDAHDLVMAAAAAGRAGGELLHLGKFGLHVGETAVLEQGIFNIRHGHVLAVADDLVGSVLHD